MRLYGTLIYDRISRQWRVDCEPQVAMRIKRLFGKVGFSTQGTIILADTLETGRDLAWFLTRYAMRITDSDREYLESRETQHQTLVEDIGRILGGEYKASEVKLAVPLREYQALAVDLSRRTRGTLIADDVGVGKTADGIGLLAHSDARPALVVTLTHLPRQWKAEIDRFCPGLKTHILKSGQPYDFAKADLFDRSGFPDVVISNYHKLAGWAGEFAGKFRTVIFDEVQELRRHSSAKYRAADSIASSAVYRLGLSATPIHNYGGEMFNVMEVLRPGAMGSWEEFATEWCSGYADRTKATIKDPKAFGSYARESGLMLRRTRKDVGRELPDLTIVPHVIDADTSKLDEIATSAARLAKIILEQGGDAFGKMQAGGEFDWRLRQATGIAKAPYVADFVRLLVESGEPVLLYGWHREVYSLWAERLKDLEPVFFTGEETPKQKQASLDAFLSGKTKVLIMSLRAGAGIDGLQKVCRTVVNGELDWSPAVHEQGGGRAYRDGQLSPVVIYYLLSEEGSDPVIADILGIKRGQLDGIRDPNAELVIKSQADPERIKRLAEDYLKRYTKAA